MKWNCNTDCEYSKVAGKCSIVTDPVIGKPALCCKFAMTCDWIPESQNVVINKEPLSDAEKSVFDSLRENARSSNQTPEKDSKRPPKLTQDIFNRVKKDPKWVCASVNKGGKAYFWTRTPTLYQLGGSWQSSSNDGRRSWREIKGNFDDEFWYDSLIFRDDQKIYKVGGYVYYRDGFKFGVSKLEGFAKIIAIWGNAVRIQTEASDFSVKFTEITPAYSIPWDFNNAPIALKVRSKKHPTCKYVASLNHYGTGYQVEPSHPSVSFNVFHDEYEQLNGMPCGELRIGSK